MHTFGCILEACLSTFELSQCCCSACFACLVSCRRSQHQGTAEANLALLQLGSGGSAVEISSLVSAPGNHLDSTAAFQAHACAHACAHALVQQLVPQHVVAAPCSMFSASHPLASPLLVHTCMAPMCGSESAAVYACCKLHLQAKACCPCTCAAALHHLQVCAGHRF